MNYEKTLTYVTVERFSCKTALECRKRLLEMNPGPLPENQQKELEHVNKKLEQVYEKDRIRAEKVRDQKGIPGE